MSTKNPTPQTPMTDQTPLNILTAINKVLLTVGAARCQLAAVELPPGMRGFIQEYPPKISESLRAAADELMEFHSNLVRDLTGEAHLDIEETDDYRARVYTTPRDHFTNVYEQACDLATRLAFVHAPDELDEDRFAIFMAMKDVTKNMQQLVEDLSAPAADDDDEGGPTNV